MSDCPILRSLVREGPSREELGEEHFAVLVSKTLRALGAGIVYTASDYASMCEVGAEAYESAHSLWSAFKALEDFDKLADPAKVAAKNAAPLMDDELVFALSHIRAVARAQQETR